MSTEEKHDSARTTHEAEGQEGSIGILAVGLCLIVLVLAVTVIAVTSVYVEQRKLQLLADQSADAATTRLTDFRGPPGMPRPVLSTEGVSQAAHEVITTVPHGIEGVSVAPETRVEGTNTAHVGLTAIARPPIVNVFIPEGVPIEASSSSRVLLTQ